MTRRENLAWLAGFLDGEGTIGVRKTARGGAGRISLVNTSEEAMRRAYNLLCRFGTVNFYDATVSYKRNPLGKLPLFRLEMNRAKGVLSALLALKPFLTVKRDPAIQVILFTRANLKRTVRCDGARRSFRDA